MITVRCPHCNTVFDAARNTTDAPPSTASTLRSLEPVHEPIRDGVPVCGRCGLIERFHEGADNLAAARGCTQFTEAKDG